VLHLRVSTAHFLKLAAPSFSGAATRKPETLNPPPIGQRRKPMARRFDTCRCKARYVTLVTPFQWHYQQHRAQLPASAVAAPADALNFFVAGYDSASPDGTLYSIDIPSPTPPTTLVRSTDSGGPWWIGQVDVISRIVKGSDFRALDFPFIKAALAIPRPRHRSTTLEFSLYSNTMTV
jgi:hypothetical protein